MPDTKEILNALPGKDCGGCGCRTCAAFAEVVAVDPGAVSRCIHTKGVAARRAGRAAEQFAEADITWRDHLGREYDFILDKFPGEEGPRETIIPFNPANVEKLGIRKGDVLYGRPGWISCGCPVTHCGVVVEEPDYFNGTLVWCIVGPMAARQRGISIGGYNTTAYEGLVRHTRQELRIGRRYYFLPRYCMLQWRHCGLVNSLGRTPDGLRVRIEGLWIA
ncbi:MAG TPA: (Fe-S)-binding protein [Phycisphaerae bacterium]|nr:(Fe-S)-binding protein [Phycisphaerae bacterium]